MKILEAKPKRIKPGDVRLAGVKEIYEYLVEVWSERYEIDPYSNSVLMRVLNEIGKLETKIPRGVEIASYEWQFDPSDSGSRGGSEDLYVAFGLSVQFVDGTTFEKDSMVYYDLEELIDDEFIDAV